MIHSLSSEVLLLTYTLERNDDDGETEAVTDSENGVFMLYINLHSHQFITGGG